MAISLVAVAAKITAAITNTIITAVNAQGQTFVTPTAVTANGTGTIAIGARGKVTYSGAPKISIDWDTTVYDNFLVVNNVSSSTAGVNGKLLLRVAAVDIVTGYSDNLIQLPTTAGAISSVASIATYLPFVRVGGTHGAFHRIEIAGAALARYTFVIATSQDEAVYQTEGGSLQTTATVGGITIDLTGSTNAGELRIYGWNNGS